MSSLSKLKASLALATNDITLSAASINFDFSLFKVEAPASYHPLGKTLSPRRRDDAEFGTPHATARRLGALFEKIIPQTPTLMSAYGTRVSEISALLDEATRDCSWQPFCSTDRSRWHYYLGSCDIWHRSYRSPSAGLHVGTGLECLGSYFNLG
jgi:hypothetical protein